MPSAFTEAQALLNGDRETLARVASRLLKPLKNNFVERPWGGTRMREYKRLAPLPDQRAATGMGLGEAFEIAVCDGDSEAVNFLVACVLRMVQKSASQVCSIVMRRPC